MFYDTRISNNFPHWKSWITSLKFVLGLHGLISLLLKSPKSINIQILFSLKCEGALWNFSVHLITFVGSCCSVLAERRDAARRATRERRVSSFGLSWKENKEIHLSAALNNLNRLSTGLYSVGEEEMEESCVRVVTWHMSNNTVTTTCKLPQICCSTSQVDFRCACTGGFKSLHHT